MTTFFGHPLFWLFQCLQPFPLEKQHIEHSDCDGRISEIEDRTEEDEMPVGTEEELGQPGSIFACYIDDGEVEHVDHASVQPAGIASPVGK